MKTAVEFLIEQCPRIETIASSELIEQAKEMEKQQIIDAVYYTCSSMTHYDLPCGEQYYNETYKSE